MRVLPIRNSDDVQEVAATILCNALADSEKAELIESMIADQEANRRELVHTAFAMGAMSALDEVMQGHLIGFQSKEN
jgi:hypothetical protein